MSRKIKFVLTKHAQDRMLQRNVSLEDIRKTLDKPTATFPKQPDNTQEFRRDSGNKINFVVVEHLKNNRLKIITTGWT